MVNFYAEYAFNEDTTLRYTYSKNDVYQYVFRDGDYTTRVGTADDHSLSTDGGVPFIDRAYDLPYDYEEESHELLLTWQVNDKMNLIIGAFDYESEVQFQLTRWEYSHDFRFVDPDEAAAALDGVFGVPVTDCRSYIENVVGATFGLPITDAGDGSFWYCPGEYGVRGREIGDLRAIVPFGTGSLNETRQFLPMLNMRLTTVGQCLVVCAGLKMTRFSRPKLSQVRSCFPLSVCQLLLASRTVVLTSRNPGTRLLVMSRLSTQQKTTT